MSVLKEYSLNLDRNVLNTSRINTIIIRIENSFNNSYFIYVIKINHKNYNPF